MDILEASALEELCTKLISDAGAAKSMYIEAIYHARVGKMDSAKKSLKDGNKYFLKGHETHYSMIQKEFKLEKSMQNLLLIHAEDQMSTAETFKILADELIKMYEILSKNNLIITNEL